MSTLTEDIERLTVACANKDLEIARLEADRQQTEDAWAKQIARLEAVIRRLVDAVMAASGATCMASYSDVRETMGSYAKLAFDEED
ncbi:MAG TPA: hypothetical protein VGL61_06505 [Kofleriaceae bacterium]|jgi:hypothetical protein